MEEFYPEPPEDWYYGPEPEPEIYYSHCEWCNDTIEVETYAVARGVGRFREWYEVTLCRACAIRDGFRRA